METTLIFIIFVMLIGIIILLIAMDAMYWRSELYYQMCNNAPLEDLLKTMKKSSKDSFSYKLRSSFTLYLKKIFHETKHERIAEIIIAINNSWRSTMLFDSLVEVGEEYYQRLGQALGYCTLNSFDDGKAAVTAVIDQLSPLKRKQAYEQAIADIEYYDLRINDPYVTLCLEKYKRNVEILMAS